MNQDSGPIAVFGFYLLSGFMMTATINGNYFGSKWWGFRFLANRWFRIFPVYWFFVIFTVILVGIRGNTVFNYIDDLGRSAVWGFPFDYSEVKDIFLNELSMEYFRKVDVKYPFFFIMNGFPKIIPQAWSLTSEIVFYLSAPFLVGLYGFKRSGKTIFYVLFGIFVLIPLSTLFLGLDFPAYRYRSTFSVFFIFLSGMLLFYERNRLAVFLNKRAVIYWVSLGILLFLITTKCRFFLNEFSCYLSLLLHMLIIITAFNLRIESVFWHNLDRILGKLAYGMFLGHFAAFFMARMLMEHLMFPFSSSVYVTGSILLTFIMSAISYYLVEANIDRIRGKLKKTKPSAYAY